VILTELHWRGEIIRQRVFCARFSQHQTTVDPGNLSVWLYDRCWTDTRQWSQLVEKLPASLVICAKTPRNS